MQVDEKTVAAIVEQVLKNMNLEAALGGGSLASSGDGRAAGGNGRPAAPAPVVGTGYGGMIEGGFASRTAAAAPQAPAAPRRVPSVAEAGVDGIFAEVHQAVEAAALAQKQLIRLSKEKRERFIQAIRQASLEHSAALARMAIEETKIGRYEDKITKNDNVAKLTPGTEDIEPIALMGDRGLTLVEPAPYGVICAITPVTNPTSTVINNAISMIAAGNSVVFCPHPAAFQCTTETIRILHRALVAAGAPPNLIVAVNRSTMEITQEIMRHPKVAMISATGGPGLVKAALASGKKTISAGPGNPPVIVDESADIDKAAQAIVDGAAFDNNLPCIAEKVCIVLDSMADDLIRALRRSGAYEVTGPELDAVTAITVVNGQLNREFVGKDAAVILRAAGIKAGDGVRLIIMQVPMTHPLVEHEQLMPVLPIVRVKDFASAVAVAVEVEHGFGHTAVIHSHNLDHITEFAQAINTTIFVVNGPSYAGVGVDGEGPCTMTVAGPTGEGVTTPRSFTRQRRFSTSRSLNYV